MWWFTSGFPNNSWSISADLPDLRARERERERERERDYRGTTTTLGRESIIAELHTRVEG